MIKALASALSELKQWYGSGLIGHKSDGVGAIATTIEDKLKIKIDPTADFGAVGDGVTDDKTAISKAITHATSFLIGQNNIVIDLAGRTYGIGSPLSIPSGVVVSNFGFIAVGTWDITKAVIFMDNTENSGVYLGVIDAQWKCACIRRGTAKRSIIKKCLLQRFNTFGVKDHGTTQESVLTESVIKQYIWNDPGFDVPANRTAPCLWVDTADSIYSDLVMATAGIPLYVTGALNMFTNIHCYNGAAPGAGNIPNIKIEDLGVIWPEGNIFTNIYCDNGIIQIVDAFQQQFNNINIHKNGDGTNTIGIELITSVADSDAAGLSFTDVKVNSGISTANTLVFSTTGAGSWATNKKISWHGVRRTDGSAGYKLAQWLDKAALLPGGTLVIGGTEGSTFGNKWPAIAARGATTTFSSIGALNYGATVDGGELILGNSRGGALETFSPLLTGDKVGTISFVGDDGNSVNAGGGKISLVTTVDWTGANRSSDLIFSTSNSNVITDRWAVSAGGRLKPVADNTYSIGDASFRPTEVYAVTGTINTSDEREKTDIQDAALGLDFINSLRPVSYKWKVGRHEIIGHLIQEAIYDEEGNTVQEEIVEYETLDIPGARTHYGLLAQEVKAAVESAGVDDFAGWILDNPNDPESRQGLRYDQFAAPMIKAMQELSSTLSSVEARLSALSDRIDVLESQP